MVLTCRWACPGVRARAGLHADQAGRPIGKERLHRPSLERLAQHRMTRGIHTVEWKDIVCRIHADHANLVHGPLTVKKGRRFIGTNSTKALRLMPRAALMLCPRVRSNVAPQRLQ